MSYVVWLENRTRRQHLIVSGEFRHNARCEYAWLRAGIDMKRLNLLVGFEVREILREGVAEIAAHLPYFGRARLFDSCPTLLSCLDFLRSVMAATEAQPLALVIVRRTSESGEMLRNRRVPSRQFRDPNRSEGPCGPGQGPPPTGMGPVDP